MPKYLVEIAETKTYAVLVEAKDATHAVWGLEQKYWDGELPTELLEDTFFDNSADFNVVSEEDATEHADVMIDPEFKIEGEE